jgi:hypothetical protein
MRNKELLKLWVVTPPGVGDYSEEGRRVVNNYLKYNYSITVLARH